jgi:hypothetical protein
MFFIRVSIMCGLNIFHGFRVWEAGWRQRAGRALLAFVGQEAYTTGNLALRLHLKENGLAL